MPRPEAGHPVLLDTCAAIWLMNGDPLSAASRHAIVAAQTASTGVHVSPITAWEVAILVRKGRIRLSLSVDAWFDALLALPGIRLADLTPKVLIASSDLPGTPPRDPADCIIAATGRAFDYVIITRDGELIPYARAGYIKAVAC